MWQTPQACEPDEHLAGPRLLELDLLHGQRLPELLQHGGPHSHRPILCGPALGARYSVPRVRLLLLGGTKFLGRAAADEALRRGHELTLSTAARRTRTSSRRPSTCTATATATSTRCDGRDLGRGDRPVRLRATRRPRLRRAAAATPSSHYVFVSSVSVYRDFSRAHFDETAPRIELEDPTVEEVMEHYGGLKALCEDVVAEVFPGRSANVRAGLIVGPHDPTDRFTYWPARVARGGEVLAPGRPDRPVEFVDARDLGAWLVTARRAAHERRLQRHP